MSNANRERKLLHHQKPIWRKAFEASMSHTSVEGAERNAWKAVDVWDRVGAFNECSSETSSGSVHPEKALHTFRRFLNDAADVELINAKSLYEIISDFDDGRISEITFGLRIAELLGVSE